MLSKYISIEECYLFGSYVKGTWIKHSDIDLVIVSKDFGGLNMSKRLDLLYRVQWENNIEHFIEVIPLTPEEFSKKLRSSAVLMDASKYWIKIV